LDLGCGTGVVARALASRKDFIGKIVGIDYSNKLIETANRLSNEEGIASRVEFRVGDSTSLDEEDEIYDVVILHTLVSHVPDPLATISEAGRVAKVGGTIAIFDGDYASVTFATGDHKDDAEMVQAMLSAVVANPYVMRELPSIIREVGLEISDFIPNILAEAGAGAFFSGFADAYVPMAVKAGIISHERSEDWLNAYRDAASKDSAFASCNYFTYLATRSK
jgi:SAM-dependent methyltransferase